MGLFGEPNIKEMKAMFDINSLINALSFKKGKHAPQDAAYALGEIGHVGAVEPLIALFKKKNKDKDVCRASADALDRLGWEPDQGENGAWCWITKNDWKNHISALGAAAIEPLVSVLENDHVDKNMRRDAADVLAMISELSVEPLIVLLKDEVADISTRRAAAAVLGKIGNARAVEPFIAILKDEYADKAMHRIAADTLGKIGNLRVVESLKARLIHREKDVRQAAKNVLKKIKTIKS